jgi:hypothetical protein
MLDEKTIRSFGNATRLEYLCGLSCLNFDKKRGFLLHKGSKLQRTLLFLNTVHIWGYMAFLGISLLNKLKSDKPKPSEIFWLLLYFCAYTWQSVESTEFYIHRKEIARAFNCTAHLARNLLLGKKTNE